ncbi:hypothetical protein D9758_013832 [Tetrapyrgos nigripes]|uniref:Glutaminase A central domain-containing protein n=1 Tax=Tetrapyrgos nigripes TaxID=182062 RepID=A0A8H5CWB7_9AGAR|nr:hypothetical protein D9758_013832 [Tetrapyrgos nigripes]
MFDGGHEWLYDGIGTGVPTKLSPEFQAEVTGLESFNHKKAVVVLYVYDIHTEFCQTQLSNAITSGANFGIQLTSQIAGEARSSWTMLVAATLTNNNTRNALVHGVYNHATFNQSGNRNFPLIYNIETGKPLESSCPAQGAMFSLLALQKGTKGFSDTNSTNSDPNQPDPPLKPKSGTGIIAGAVIGSLLGIALIVAAFVFFRRRKQRLQAQRRLLVPHSYPDPQLSMSMSAPPPQRSKMSTQPSASTAESSSSGVPSYRRKNRFTATPQPVPELAAAGTPPEEPSDTTQLRNDMSFLRREIEEIRQQREYDVPPPVYT